MINIERRERAIQNVVEAMRNVFGPSANVAEIEILAREYENKVISQAKSVEEYYSKIEQKLSSLRKKKPATPAVPPAEQPPHPGGSEFLRSSSAAVAINLPPASVTNHTGAPAPLGQSQLLLPAAILGPTGIVSSAITLQTTHASSSNTIESTSETSKLFLVR